MEAPPKADVSGSLFEKIFGKPEYVEDLPSTETTPQVARMRAEIANFGDNFTCMVHILRSDASLPESVRQLGALLWDLVGNRITPVAFGPRVDSIHFWAEVPREGKPVGCILCPPNWLDMTKKDPFMQFGALVYVASQARDFYNVEPLYHGRDAIQKRALAFEAEYLHTLANHPLVEWFKPNDYQKKVMAEFPKGLASLDPALWYESKPFVKK